MLCMLVAVGRSEIQSNLPKPQTPPPLYVQCVHLRGLVHLTVVQTMVEGYWLLS